MADTTTTAKAFTKPEVGAHEDTWGAVLNTNFDLIDSAIGGVLSKSITGDTTLNSTEAENVIYKFSGAISAIAAITFPTFYGVAEIVNGTTGGFAITVGSGSTTVKVAAGFRALVYSDGTDFKRVIDTAKVLLGEKTITSGDATCDSTGIDSTYPSYELEWENVVPATDATNIQIRVGTGGTPTYDSAANYRWTSNTLIITGTGGNATGAGDTRVIVTSANDGVSNSAGNGGMSGSLVISDPSSAAKRKLMRFDVVSNIGGDILHTRGGAEYASTTAVTALRTMAGAGNLASGKVRLWGIP